MLWNSWLKREIVLLLQYLEENVHQPYVDVSVMARQLQERYPEYGRRKHRPFRFLVDQGKERKAH